MTFPCTPDLLSALSGSCHPQTWWAIAILFVAISIASNTASTAEGPNNRDPRSDPASSAQLSRERSDIRENGGYHPGLDPNHGQPELIVGLHAGRRLWAVHLSYFRYFLGPEDIGLASNLDWMNLSLEIRF